jgi:hypothetical protein
MEKKRKDPIVFKTEYLGIPVPSREESEVRTKLSEMEKHMWEHFGVPPEALHRGLYEHEKKRIRSCDNDAPATDYMIFTGGKRKD